MPDFSIRILPSNGGAVFDPMSVPPGSSVTWNNLTGQTHQITSGTFSTQPIGPKGTPTSSSRPDFEIAPSATEPIAYACTLHENESGTIGIDVVQNLPTED